MSGWYPEAVRLPIRTKEYYQKRATALIGIVDHVTAGSDSRGWLQNAENQSSVHFLIRMEGGKAVAYQFMPVEWGAWGNGRYSDNNPYMPEWVKFLIRRNININHATVSIEHEKATPFNNDMPAPMLAASIKLHKWLIATYPTLRADREHVIGHYQIDAQSRAFCPGGPGGKGFPFDKIIAAMKAASDPPPTPKPAIDAYAETHPYVGLPLWAAEKAMVLEDGREYQCKLFERALLHWRPGEGVGEARIGAMYQDAINKLEAIT